MDVDGLDARARRRSATARSAPSRSTRSAPSPMSHEILNANPYAYLDDAPLEERRARAVALRRTDARARRRARRARRRRRSPRCARQAWPDVRDADELHDALLSLGLAAARASSERAGWRGARPTSWWTRGRATWARGDGAALVAAERVALRAAARSPTCASSPPVQEPLFARRARASEEDALRADRRRLARVRRARRRVPELAARLGLAPARVADRARAARARRASRCAAASPRRRPTRSGASARCSRASTG